MLTEESKDLFDDVVARDVKEKILMTNIHGSQLEEQGFGLKLSTGEASRLNSDAVDLDGSNIELVFTRDCIIIRTPIIVPLKGKSFHEEKIEYDKIPSGSLQMQVESITRQEENGQLKALILRVSKFEQANNEISKQTGRTLRVRSSWIKYSFMDISECRSLFPGFKIPFVLTTDQGDITTHVTSAEKGTPYGAPLEGKIISYGLKEWYSSHPEIRVGDRILIETIEPNRHYRISPLGHELQSELPTQEENLANEFTNLEKCGTAKMQTEEQTVMQENPKTKTCPECGSDQIIEDDRGVEAVCFSCGLTFKNSAYEVAKTPPKQEDQSYGIQEEQGSYKIVCGPNAQMIDSNTVGKDTVENIYHHLKRHGEELTDFQIENTMTLPIGEIQKALKVLIFQRRVKSCWAEKERVFLYQAI